MRVRRNQGMDYTFENFIKLDTRLDYGRDPINIFIDPGKTNLGLIVTDCNKTILDILELSGTSVDGVVESLEKYCSELRILLTKMMKLNCVIALFHEDAISKKGNQYHVADITLKSIRGTIRTTAYDCDVRVVEINNSAWKGAVLPAKYMKAHIKKGSLLLTKDMGLNFREDDISDCFCLMLYKDGDGTVRLRDKYTYDYPTEEYVTIFTDSILQNTDGIVIEDNKSMNNKDKIHNLIKLSHNSKVALRGLPYLKIELKDWIKEYTQSEYTNISRSNKSQDMYLVAIPKSRLVQ